MSTIDINTVVSEECDMVMCFVPKAANAKDITKDLHSHAQWAIVLLKW
jgi:hypothetical protein